MAVKARLQSITWQGRPALMLSAMPGDEPRGHEGAVRSFAEVAADAREEGFIRTDRNGIVTQLSLHARVVFGKTEAVLAEHEGLKRVCWYAMADGSGGFTVFDIIDRSREADHTRAP